jgi:glutathione S-transferase
MLRIWGRVTSINVQKVVWCADELGLAYERIDVGGAFGGTTTPAYLAMNPNSYVPTIEEDGFTLYESNAIVRYLAARDATARLWPGDLRARADADRWMEWQSTTFSPAMRDAFWQLIRTPEASRDAGTIEKSTAASERLAVILDDQLGRHEYITPNGFTAADLVVGCAAHRWLNLPVRRPKLANLERWYALLKSRAASRQVTSQALS